MLIKILQTLSYTTRQQFFYMRQILLFLLILISSTMLAQELSVKDFREAANDLSARTKPRQDINGNDCALVKVQLAAPNATFIGNVMGDVTFTNNEYWVYMTAGSKRLKVTQPSYLPLEVSFADYGVSQLTGKSTYVLILLLGELPRGVQQPKVQTGWILLDSEPQGASVFVNNEFVGNTPLDGYKQPYGTYSYRVEHPNYHSTSGSIELNTGRLEKKIILKPAFGVIDIKCNIVGASVLLDGKTTGQKTPCTLHEVASGQHTITLQKDKFAPRQENIIVEDGKTAKMDIYLNARFATISIVSLEGAQIFCNGKEIGRTAVKEDMMEGYYDIEVKLSHHKAVTRQIQVVAGQRQQITLNPIPIYGSLDITSTPRDADVTIDGKHYGKTPLTVEQLLAGEHEINLSKSQYAPERRTIIINEDENLSIDVTFNYDETEPMTSEELYNKGDSLYKQEHYVDALDWFKKAADKGNDMAQLKLGLMYSFGEGVRKNKKEAMTWYLKAANQGNLGAQTNVGHNYESGQGVKKDYLEALNWYRMAADQGYPDAQRSMGNMYFKGHGVSKDYSQALKWYKMAADQGDGHAQYLIGEMYYWGYGVRIDRKAAIEWYKKAEDDWYEAGERLRQIKRDQQQQQINNRILRSNGSSIYPYIKELLR